MKKWHIRDLYTVCKEKISELGTEERVASSDETSISGFMQSHATYILASQQGVWDARVTLKKFWNTSACLNEFRN